MCCTKLSAFGKIFFLFCNIHYFTTNIFLGITGNNLVMLFVSVYINCYKELRSHRSSLLPEIVNSIGLCIFHYLTPFITYLCHTTIIALRPCLTCNYHLPIISISSVLFAYHLSFHSLPLRV